MPDWRWCELPSFNNLADWNMESECGEIRLIQLIYSFQILSTWCTRFTFLCLFESIFPFLEFIYLSCDVLCLLYFLVFIILPLEHSYVYIFDTHTHTHTQRIKKREAVMPVSVFIISFCCHYSVYWIKFCIWTKWAWNVTTATAWIHLSPSPPLSKWNTFIYLIFHLRL